MRSVADDLRREGARALAALTADERIALALRLGDEDVALYCAVHRVSERSARAQLANARATRRRSSVANEPKQR